MTEPDRTGELDAAFAPFHSGDPLVVPAGAAAARQVSARRRRTRSVATAALTALVIAVPATAYATGMLEDRGGPTTVEPSTGPPSPSGSPSPDPLVTPSTTPPAAPDGRISAEELGNATIEVPSWREDVGPGCPDGRVRFTDGRASGTETEMGVRIGQVVHLDLDRDGAQETVATVICSGLRTIQTVVLALDRNTAGAVVPLGTVLAQGGGIGTMDRLRVAGTAVEVRVWDYPDLDTPLDRPQSQWRAYSWNGSRFVQSAGPTSFPPNSRVTDLSISGGDLRLSPVETGGFAGTLTLTVRNAGPTRATAATVRLTLPSDMAASGPGLRCHRDDRRECVRTMAVEVGQRVTLTFQISTKRASTGANLPSDYLAGVGWEPFLEPEGRYGDNEIKRKIVLG